MKISNNKKIYICIIILIVMSIIRGKSIETPYISTLVFILNFITYASMLLMWIISIYRRILHKNIRRYIMTIGFLMLFWLLFRTSRHRIFVNSPEIQIFLWYCYYIPITLVPLISYYVALTIGNKEGYVIDRKHKLLIIPEVIILLTILTNSFHQLAFTLPKHAIFPGKVHGYNIVYYITSLWVVGLLFTSMYIIFRKCRVKESKNRIIEPFIIVNVGIIYAIFYYLNPLHKMLAFMELTLVFSIVIVLFWESCIKSGLIASNSKYKIFFKNSTLDIVILDKEGKPYYSNQKLSIENEIFQQLKQENKVRLDKNTQLYAHKINGGYVIWKEELSSILNLIKELENINLELQDEVILIQKQIQTQAQMIRYKEKIRLYDIIKQKTNSQLEKIKENLEKAKKNKHDTKLWIQINVLATYVKRCVNLILISQSDANSKIDFELAIKETFEKLKQNGVDVSIKNGLNENINVSDVLEIYSIIQYVIEILFLDLKQLFLNIKIENDDYIIYLIAGLDNINDYKKDDIHMPISNYSIEFEKNLINFKIILSKKYLEARHD